MALAALGGERRIEPDLGSAQISSTSAKAAKPTLRSAARGRYRNVKLIAPAAPPKTSISKLQRAVEDAVAKNADVLAGRK